MALRAEKKGFRAVLLVLLLPCLLPAALLSVYHYVADREQHLADARIKALLFAQLISEKQAGLVEQAKTVLLTLEASGVVLERDREYCTRLFRTLIAQSEGAFYNIAAVAPDGQAFLSAISSPEKLNYADRQWFKDAMAHSGFTFSGFLIGRSSGKPAMVVAYPDRDGGGAVRFVTWVGFDLNWWSQHLSLEQLPPGAEVTVVDPGGEVLAQYPPDPGLMGRKVDGTADFGDALKQGSGSFEGKRNGVVQLFGFTRLVEGQANSPVIFVGIPRHAVEASALRVLYAHLGWLALASLLAAGLFWLAGEKLLIRPVRALSDAALSLGRGGTDARAPADLGTREFDLLASVFNRMADALTEAALLDELTGLYNRRGFLTVAAEEIKAARRMGRTAFILFVDLNGMKSVNDRFGHHEGDRMLRDMAALMRGTFRESDVLARLGGDEFTAFGIEELPGGPDKVRSRLNERLEKFLAEADRPYELSFCCGVVNTGPGDTESLQDLLALADARMYEEKKALRRNSPPR